MRDEWSGFAGLLSNLIAKYAKDLDIDNLPDPDSKKIDEEKEGASQSGIAKGSAA